MGKGKNQMLRLYVGKGQESDATLGSARSSDRKKFVGAGDMGGGGTGAGRRRTYRSLRWGGVGTQF